MVFVPIVDQQLVLYANIPVRCRGKFNKANFVLSEDMTNRIGVEQKVEGRKGGRN